MPCSEGTALSGSGLQDFADRICRPALIEESFTVVVLGPGHVAWLEDHGPYDVTIEPS